MWKARQHHSPPQRQLTPSSTLPTAPAVAATTPSSAPAYRRPLSPSNTAPVDCTMPAPALPRARIITPRTLRYAERRERVASISGGTWDVPFGASMVDGGLSWSGGLVHSLGVQWRRGGREMKAGKMRGCVRVRWRFDELSGRWTMSGGFAGSIAPRRDAWSSRKSRGAGRIERATSPQGPQMVAKLVSAHTAHASLTASFRSAPAGTGMALTPQHAAACVVRWLEPRIATC